MCIWGDRDKKLVQKLKFTRTETQERPGGLRSLSSFSYWVMKSTAPHMTKLGQRCVVVLECAFYEKLEISMFFSITFNATLHLYTYHKCFKFSLCFTLIECCMKSVVELINSLSKTASMLVIDKVWFLFVLFSFRTNISFQVQKFLFSHNLKSFE